jgi:hypothetical protein
MINLVTRKKLKGFTPTRVIRTGPFKLVKKYEYNFISGFLYKEAVRMNPDAEISAAAGIVRVKK